MEPLNPTWTRVGPARPTGTPVPPEADNGNYLLDYDAEHRCVVYAFRSSPDQFGAAWAFDGVVWKPFATRPATFDQVVRDWAGGFHPAFGGLVGLSALRNGQPVGVAITPAGLVVLGSEEVIETIKSDNEESAGLTFKETTGELRIGRKSWAAFAVDRARAVVVCVSSEGVWELGRELVWNQAAAIPDELAFPGRRWRPQSGQDSCTAVWSPSRGAVVVRLIDDEDESVHVLEWNGRALVRLPAAGLPEDLHDKFSDRSAVLAEHPAHGLVLYSGSGEGRGAFTPGADGWAPLALGEGLPGSMGTRMAFDPQRELWVAGPGAYEGLGKQQLFHVRRGQRWERHGVIATPSPIDEIRESGGGGVLGVAGDAQVATGWRTTLHTAVWRAESGWREVVDAKEGERLFALGSPDGYRRVLIEAMDGKLHALATSGAVYRFEGDTWTVAAPADPSFDGWEFFEAAYDPASNRIVAFRGFGDDETRFFDGGKWAPPAFDGVAKAEAIDGPGLYYDTALGKVVSVGKARGAILANDAWVSQPVPGLAEVSEYRAVFHDPKTKETLLLRYHHGELVRFDFAGCTTVGTLSTPADIQQELDRANRGRVQTFKLPLEPDFVFDPKTRLLSAHCRYDRWGSYQVDLGPAFERAASFGPRTIPDLANAPSAPRPPRVRLPRVLSPLGEKVVGSLRSWAATNPVTYLKNAPQLVERLGRHLEPVVGGNVREAGAEAIPLGGSKLGGLPHVPVEGGFEWPNEDGTEEPLAFVCQINLGELTGDDRLPREGLLYLFSIFDSDRAYGGDIGDSTAKLLYVKAPGALQVAARPDSLDEAGVFPERRVALGPSLVCEEVKAGKASRLRFDGAIEDRFVKVLVEQGGAPTGTIQLLGRPHTFLPEDEYTARFDLEKEQLLLEVDGNGAAPDAFGEGTFFVMIDQAALAAGDLGAARIDFVPGT